MDTALEFNLGEKDRIVQLGNGVPSGTLSRNFARPSRRALFLRTGNCHDEAASLVKLGYNAKAEKRLTGLVYNLHPPFRTSFNWMV